MAALLASQMFCTCISVPNGRISIFFLLLERSCEEKTFLSLYTLRVLHNFAKTRKCRFSCKVACMEPWPLNRSIVVMLCYGVLCCIVLCCVTLCYVMLYYVMLCYVYGYLYSAPHRRLFRGALSVTGRCKEKSSRYEQTHIISSVA